MMTLKSRCRKQGLQLPALVEQIVIHQRIRERYMTRRNVKETFLYDQQLGDALPPISMHLDLQATCYQVFNTNKFPVHNW
jgi:hypothetical protein